ncbi:MAG: glycosyltransferase family 4 protein, partial [Phycisphaerales bacterium]|nr:glycosyltransferase family 4 protein [Phycisphaerales bacterium]
DVVSIQFLHSWGFTPEMMQTGCSTVRPWGSDICPPPTGPQPPTETIARRREMLRNASAVAVTCESFRNTVARYADIDPAGIAITPLGVDLKEFQPAPPPSGPPVVGFLKGFGHAYGAPVFVRALPKIATAFPNVLFELVGEGPTLPECHNLAQNLGVTSHIRWLPRLAPAQVADTLARWSVSVIPSLTESFCIAALESSAMRVPVVASAVGGLSETVVDGQTGVLVPPSQPDAIANAVIELLATPQRRCEMGSAGRAFVESRYAWERCMNAWEAFFENAIHRRGVGIANYELQITN